MTEHEKWMKYAFREAEKAFDREEIPIGCVVVFQNSIIAKTYNQVETLKDATAHAEILAITSASAYLQSKYLVGCSMYITLEPCVMCAGALVNAKLENLFFGAFDAKCGAAGSVFNITNDKHMNHKVNVLGGVMDTECSGLITSFFELRR